MTPELEQRLRERFAEWPDTLAGPVPDQAVQSAEQALGVNLPQDFRRFLVAFGSAIIVSILRAMDPRFSKPWTPWRPASGKPPISLNRPWQPVSYR